MNLKQLILMYIYGPSNISAKIIYTSLSHFNVYISPVSLVTDDDNS